MSERELGIIIAKLDALHEDIAELKETHIETGTRIRSLENFRHWATGVGSFCVLLVATITSMIKFGGN